MSRTNRTRLLAGPLGLALVLAAAGCGEAVRTGRSPMVLVINSLEAASGADPGEFSNELSSDVQTLVQQTVNGQQVRVPTLFEDIGRVEFRLSIKDIGQPGNPTGPSPNNSVTITRYRVQFRRTDGRNTPGVDVPYPFEGAGTITIPGTGTASMGFVLVRIQAKSEAPLKALVGGGQALAISTIADVTFYGRDLAGNDIQATGSISVNFADWGDPS